MADLVGYVRPNGYDPGGYYSAAERYTNDTFHRRLSRTDCTGVVYAVHRDGEGNIIKEISPNAYDNRTMGSVTHVVDGESEEILNHYEYDTWGNLTICEEKVHNRFKFNGQQYDPISQQYYLRARYYNPVIGRFTQEDRYNVDGLNLYAYCRNNPVYYVDPSGNICEKRANEIVDKFNSGGELSNSEKKKLAAYLRNKGRRTEGGLTDAESHILNQIDRKRKKAEEIKPNRGRQNATEEEINLTRCAITC